MNIFIQLCRLRTLPLSVAVVICACGLAVWHGTAQWGVALLLLNTVLWLQIVSNIANDYGDGIRGTDVHRAAHAPQRLTISGNHACIRRHLWFSVMMSTVSGLALLSGSLKSRQDFFVFLILGAMALILAITYTIGKYAYGYFALGEVAVFLCFGLLGVLGAFYLQTHEWIWQMIFPAMGSGFLAAAVLNINNSRDINSDLLAHKRTLANILGVSGSLKLHKIFVFSGLFSYFCFSFWAWQSALWLLYVPIIMRHFQRIKHAHTSETIGHELASVVGIHFWVNVLFATGLTWATF